MWHREPTLLRDLLIESSIAAVAIIVYYVIDGLKSDSQAVAIANARGLIDFERTLGVFVELDVQSFVLKHPFLIHLANYAYLLEHWPLIAPAAIWLFMTRRDAYRYYRNVFLIAASMAFVVFVLYPVAPPRLAAAGFTDTAERFDGGLLGILQPSQLLDSYAAMPSLHLAWNIIVSVALVDQIYAPQMKYLPALLPVGMTLAIVATGNHFVLDAVAGAALAWFALLVIPVSRRVSITLSRLTIFPFGGSEARHAGSDRQSARRRPFQPAASQDDPRRSR